MPGDSEGNAFVSFSTTATGTEIRVRDGVGTHEYTLQTDVPVSLERASPDRFISPVDTAVSFTTGELHLPPDSSVVVRDGHGEHRCQLGPEPREFVRGTYYAEVSPPMKTYILVPDSAFTGYYRDYDELGTGPSLEFESETRVFLGVRSPHDRPQATITVPDDPSAIATAVSALGSALKEYSCERSWPTLRGHPPAIERGEELHVPDVLEKPDTGVTIAVPPTYADVYRVAPLAYYLGADVVTAAGIDPELRLDVGHTEPLRRPGRTLEESVDRLLARCLLLDSLVRIDGYYSFTRYEYDEVAPHLPFYPPELYGESLDAQLMEYLEVPFDVLEPYVPQWPTTAVLRPDPGDVEVVPSLLDSLSRIHVAPADESADASATGAEYDSDSGSRLFDPTVTAYAGRTPPVGETRLVPTAFENARHQKRNTPSECHLQCFGVDCGGVDAFERIRDTVVASPPDETPTLTTEGLPTRARLRRALAGDADFLHFGGRVTDAGFVCTDGVLSPSEVDEVAVSLVSIAGQRDVETLVPLVERGALAGIAHEPTSPDEQVGLLAGYLGQTFSLAAAAALGVRTPYRLVGDATTAIAAWQLPIVIDVESVAVDTHRVWYWTEPTDETSLGSILLPTEEFTQQTHSLAGAPAEQSPRVSTDELVEVFEAGFVVRLNGEVYPTSGDLTAETVRRSARRSLDGAPDQP